jgi:hypothetical protein
MRFMVATLFTATIGLELRGVWIRWCPGSHEVARRVIAANGAVLLP